LVLEERMRKVGEGNDVGEASMDFLSLINGR
jgi:hypothetical protein